MRSSASTFTKSSMASGGADICNNFIFTQDAIMFTQKAKYLVDSVDFKRELPDYHKTLELYKWDALGRTYVIITQRAVHLQ